MKKIIIITLILGSFSGTISADECTGQINAYITALETSIRSTYISDVKKELGSNEIKRITSLRNNASDCEVAMKIPSLANTKAVLEQATQAVKNR